MEVTVVIQEFVASYLASLEINNQAPNIKFEQSGDSEKSSRATSGSYTTRNGPKEVTSMQEFLEIVF